ncbi:MAG: uL15 family ribosomal protein [Patescibacteria group bacterium]
MKLHTLGAIGKKSKIRVGRGGKRGTTSGRGTKGQKSRSGHVIRPAERDLILKIPKKRGFRNKPKSEKAFPVNLEMIQRAFLGRSASGSVQVTKEALYAAKVLSRRHRGSIKILAKGEIKFPIEVKGIRVSPGAVQKIEKSGGKVLA